MFKLNLKIALRNLWKYKGYTLINVAGLSIGLAGCLLIFIFLRYQLGFDKNYENSDRIYRVVSSWSYPEGEFYSQGVPRPLPAALRQDLNQFEKVATVRDNEGIMKAEAQNGRAEVKSAESVYFAEPEFFQIFKIDWLAGEPVKALSAPFTLVLSETSAKKYFGSWQNAVGKSLKFGTQDTYKVTGVFKDFPQNSSFPFEIVISYASDPERNDKAWSSVSSRQECYVLLKEGVDVEDLKSPMAAFMKKYYVDQGPGKENHYFQPLSDIHYNENYGNYAYDVMPKSQIVGLVVIGIFLLITACINFINLATAQALSRSKEVGVRKVMGSQRKQLIWQFLSETVLITIFALLLACVLTELTIPSMEELFGGDISFSLFRHPEVFIFMFILVVVVSFLAGLYPALIMSGFSPALAIKNKVTANAGGIGLRKTLVVAQFAITAILIIGTLVVLKQMNFMRQKPLGFDSSGVAIIEMPTDSVSMLKFGIFKELLDKHPGVVSSSYCFAAPSAGNNNETNFRFNSSKDADFQVNVKPADENYFKTFDIKLVAGRALSKSDTVKEFVVNETLLKKLNISNPTEALGKIFNVNGRKGPVVGVAKDFNNSSLRDKISPIAMFTRTKSYNQLAVKIEKNRLLPTLSFVEKEWNRLFPDFVYASEFMDERIQSYYETERVMGVLFKVFAGVVIFISFIGLFGLISFVATQRTKEIAIRKVLGASNFELIKMLNSSFLWMVLIANLVAWPVAYIFVSKWLNGFEYRAPLSFWPFLLAMILSVVITLLTVSFRSYRAAKSNPIDALKYE